ncbi:hypothetical protein Pan153_06720 [Gimesia panareensis]|uniref:Knr4/Smi1-like domain-containing protein n=1 Tax=Gimesia panareensis TaxID=2527978 RepID=A0A518FI78_9PLAN|nr:hypothetical protein [Gimesia panareensis]QDV16051.1 hypothetical protein Pan153_06720 [Gimesia panareensis]
MLSEYLLLSDQMRPGYSASLGSANVASEKEFLQEHKTLPDFFIRLYSEVEGTRAGIEDQSLMDFLPGYRLIHWAELRDCCETCHKILGIDGYYPFLANYSSDFYCWKDGAVYDVSHDCPTPTLIHHSVADFLKTICGCYTSGVYFLDEDGYLDYDFEQERLLAIKLNPQVDYWLEG